MGAYQKVALGGGCHWCTEAVFQSLKGVSDVQQGFVASADENSSFSEAVIVYFDTKNITLKTLVEIHLYTHKSTCNHSMREKYRSAVYWFSEFQKEEVRTVLNMLQKDFDKQLITKVLPFKMFKASRDEITNYYFSNTEKPFCKTFINPKLKLLLDKFSKNVAIEKLNHLV